MTAAAAAAAVAAAGTAAAGTADGVTAVTAAAAVPSTRYERSLLSCARALSDFAGCTEPGAVWDDARFREWAREHRAEATKQHTRTAWPELGEPSQVSLVDKLHGSSRR